MVERHEPVLHCPLPALPNRSHLILYGNGLWVVRHSGVVLYPPGLPVIPLAIGDVARIRLRAQKGREVLPEFSSNQSIPLLCDALSSLAFLAFPSDTHQSTLGFKELLHHAFNRQMKLSIQMLVDVRGARLWCHP